MLASSSMLFLRPGFLADRAFARRTPGMPAEVLAVAGESVRLVFDDVPPRIEEAVHALRNDRAVAFEPLVRFREGIVGAVGFVPLHVMDQRDRTEAGMELCDHASEPARKRVGPDAVEDLREVLERILVEDLAAFKLVLLREVVQLKNFIGVAQNMPPYVMSLLSNGVPMLLMALPR